MTVDHILTAAEFASISTMIADLETENERLEAENEVLENLVASLEFTLQWKRDNSGGRS